MTAVTFDLEGKLTSYMTKGVPVLTDKPLKIIMYTWPRFPSIFGIVLRQYFEVWKREGRSTPKVVLAKGSTEVLEVIDKCYTRYLEDNTPFVPKLKEVECLCGTTKKEFYGICEVCKSKASLIQCYAWMQKRGRIIIKTIPKKTSTLEKISDIMNTNWDDDSKVTAIKRILKGEI